MNEAPARPRGGNGKAIALGVLAMIIGAGLWAVVTVVTEREFSLVAIGIGALVGLTMFSAKPTSTGIAAVAALLTVIGCAARGVPRDPGAMSRTGDRLRKLINLELKEPRLYFDSLDGRTVPVLGDRRRGGVQHGLPPHPGRPRGDGLRQRGRRVRAAAAVRHLSRARCGGRARPAVRPAAAVRRRTPARRPGPALSPRTAAVRAGAGAVRAGPAVLRSPAAALRPGQQPATGSRSPRLAELVWACLEVPLSYSDRGFAPETRKGPPCTAGASRSYAP